MGLVTTRAVILQTYRYSDTSKILRLMTLEHGPRSAIARGALRPRSRFGGLLEPFAEGAATMYVRENRDLHTLSDFELLRERQGLGADLQRFTGASVLCELVMRLAPEHRDERLYAALVSGLDQLLSVRRGRAAATALRQAWRLVSLLGFAPDLGRCLECGRTIGASEAARFDRAGGGLRCDRCVPSGEWIRPEELASLRALAGGGADPERVTGPQGRLLADFIRHHLAEGSNLRSLEFLGRLP